ncbi:hypothetical protein ACHQM5_009094 [Ranunculus cassubicifolius]
MKYHSLLDKLEDTMPMTMFWPLPQILLLRGTEGLVRANSEPLLLPIFPNLKSLSIEHIKIRYVLTMRVAPNLLQLEELVISWCSKMEVIFKYEDGEDIKCDEDSAILPRLNELTLRAAPKLKSFTTRNLLMKMPSLISLEVFECEILERLPFGTTSVPNHKKIGLEWEDESVKSRLGSILKLIVAEDEISNSEEED